MNRRLQFPTKRSEKLRSLSYALLLMSVFSSSTAQAAALVTSPQVVQAGDTFFIDGTGMLSDPSRYAVSICGDGRLLTIAEITEASQDRLTGKMPEQLPTWAPAEIVLFEGHTVPLADGSWIRENRHVEITEASWFEAGSQQPAGSVNLASPNGPLLPVGWMIRFPTGPSCPEVVAKITLADDRDPFGCNRVGAVATNVPDFQAQIEIKIHATVGTLSKATLASDFALALDATFGAFGVNASAVGADVILHGPRVGTGGSAFLSGWTCAAPN